MKHPWSGDNPYNCPDVIYGYMQNVEFVNSSNGRLLKAILFLGPERVQWTGTLNPDIPKAGNSDSPIMWSLDGVGTSENAIYRARQDEKET